jgi:hypothetical protein
MQRQQQGVGTAHAGKALLEITQKPGEILPSNRSGRNSPTGEQRGYLAARFSKHVQESTHLRERRFVSLYCARAKGEVKIFVARPYRRKIVAFLNN